MNNWRKTTLGEVITFISKGTTPSASMGGFSESGINFIKSESVCYNGIIDRSKFAYITEKVHNKFKRSQLQENDILFSMAGVFLGKNAIVSKDILPANTNQALSIIRINHELAFYKFIHYSLRQKSTIYYIHSIPSQSAQPNINFEEIKSIPINLPPLDEQKRIADALSALDDKIEINNKINENLEAQAQAIFKQWFVDFEFPDKEGKPYKSNGGKFIDSELGKIPEGWREGTLGDVIKNIKISIKKEEVNELPYLPIDIIPMNKLGLIEFKPSNEAQSSLIKFEKNDILIGAMRVYFHRVSISPCEGVTRSTCFVLRPIKYELLEYALLVCNQNATIDYAQNTSKGSTMPYAVWENGLSKMKIIIPSEEILDEFSIKTKPIISYLRDSLYEKINLSELRDSLLPKLMSGEVRV